MKDRIILIALIGIFPLLLSCQAAGDYQPSPADITCPPIAQINPAGTSPRLWGIWEGHISADRTQVELVPSRTAMFKLNVVGFLEQNPCTDCLQVVGKEIIGPNRVNLTIRIEHPFKGLPQFTGFDVQGGIQFPSHTYVSNRWDTNDPTILYAATATSWWRSGECQVLNPDGYGSGSFFYRPSWGDKYKFEGFINGKLGGEPVLDVPPGPDLGAWTYIWAYRMFRTTQTRNMFEVSGSDQQTYELWLPDGEIKFGYVVIAHWEPPTVTPVTNPATDFPIEANETGPYRIEVLDVSGPVSSTEPAFVTIRVHWSYDKKPLSYNSEYVYEVSYFVCSNDFTTGGAIATNWEILSQPTSENRWADLKIKLERYPEGLHQGPPGIYPFALLLRMKDTPGIGSLNNFFTEIEVLD